MQVDVKLSENLYRVGKEAHIVIDEGICPIGCAWHACLAVCPADLFEFSDTGRVTVNWEGCLECGTCMICCPEHAIRWDYPAGGRGVQYRMS